MSYVRSDVCASECRCQRVIRVETNAYQKSIEKANAPGDQEQFSLTSSSTFQRAYDFVRNWHYSMLGSYANFPLV